MAWGDGDVGRRGEGAVEGDVLRGQNGRGVDVWSVGTTGWCWPGPVGGASVSWGRVTDSGGLVDGLGGA